MANFLRLSQNNSFGGTVGKRELRSKNSFKTSYVAAVKEELGLSVRRAWNKKVAKRKVKVPEKRRTIHQCHGEAQHEIYLLFRQGFLSRRLDETD